MLSKKIFYARLAEYLKKPNDFDNILGHSTVVRNLINGKLSWINSICYEDVIKKYDPSTHSAVGFLTWNED